jgi:drug/metabolite transporter (DMT)-like permease
MIMLRLGLVAILLQATMLTAWRLGDVSALAPLDYLRLITGSLLGYLAFGEVPGPAVFAGATLIVIANFVAASRSQRGPKTLPPATPSRAAL